MQRQAKWHVQGKSGVITDARTDIIVNANKGRGRNYKVMCVFLNRDVALD
jgi:hypothetical protein